MCSVIDRIRISSRSQRMTVADQIAKTDGTIDSTGKVNEIDFESEVARLRTTFIQPGLIPEDVPGSVWAI